MKSAFPILGVAMAISVICCRPQEHTEERSQAKQGRQRIDSLEQALALQNADTGKVKTLCGLSFQYSTVDTEKGIEFGRQALSLSKDLRWRKGTAFAYNSIGTNYLNSSAPAEALVMFDSSLVINSELNYFLGQATNYRNRGIANKELGFYDRARADFNESRELYTQLGNEEGIIGASCNLGTVLLDEEKYEDALLVFDEANKLALQFDSKRNLVVGYNNASFAYRELKKYTEADSMARKALTMGEELKDNFGLYLSNKNLGAVEMMRGNYVEAREHFKTSLAYARELGSADRQSQAYLYLGENAMRFCNDHEAGKGPSTSWANRDTAMHYYWSSLQLVNKKDKKAVLKTLDLMKEGYAARSDSKSVQACEALAAKLENGNVEGHPVQMLGAARE